MATERVTMMVCDAPGCDARYEHSKYEPAFGFHLGKGMWHNGGGGGPIPSVYACSIEHIGPAVDHVIQEAGW